MKKLMLTSAHAAFAILDEYAGLYGDNGGDPDGPAWLPSDQDDIPADLVQMVIEAGHGELVNAATANDEEMCQFLDLPLPAEDESQQDLKERIAARLGASGDVQWAHYGAYGASDSEWVFIVNEQMDAHMQRVLWTKSGRQSYNEYRFWFVNSEYPHPSVNFTKEQVRTEAEHDAVKNGLTDEYPVQREAFINGFLVQYREEHEDR